MSSSENSRIPPEEVIAILPMRSGSKGLPRKNFAVINGKSLAQLVAEPLRDSGRVGRMVCSTDSLELASLARDAGFEVPFLRPEALSGDTAPTSSAIEHMLSEIDNLDTLSTILVVQATSPLLVTSDIIRALEMLEQSALDSVITVVRTPDHWHWEMQVQLDERHVATTILGERMRPTRRQEFPSSFTRVGLLYACRIDSFLRTKNIMCGITGAIEVDAFRSINIDTQDDMELLRSRHTSSPGKSK